MRLIDLLRQNTENITIPAGADAVNVTGVACDSRHVEPGDLFVAIPGAKEDGVSYARQAIAQGAVAVCAESPVPNGWDVAIPWITFASGLIRQALSCFATTLYAAQPAHIVGITGTDGKTSVAEFCRQLWTKQGLKAASIGTLGVYDGSLESIHLSNTTPDAVTLHKTLLRLAKSHVDAVSIEISSIGVDQYRAHGVHLAAAACTNLGRDHLDYHGTMQAYEQAKHRLFSEILPEGKTAILNADDPAFQRFAGVCESRKQTIVTFGEKNAADFRVVSYAPHVSGARVMLSLRSREYAFDFPLVGRFQLWNALMALALVEATGQPLDQMLTHLTSFSSVPGRLERVAQTSAGGVAYIDYAHTAQALSVALSTLRAHTQGRLIAVFGCGGDRDKGKRPEMGRVAAELADHVIITDDNPRGEDPAMIRAEVAAACQHADMIGDRAQAIAAGIANLKAGDVLLVAGKGHETTQTIGDKIIPFNDKDVIQHILNQQSISAQRVTL